VFIQSPVSFGNALDLAACKVVIAKSFPQYFFFVFLWGKFSVPGGREHRVSQWVAGLLLCVNRMQQPAS